MTGLNAAVDALVSVDRALRRILESTRATWDDDARTAFDRAHTESLQAAGRWAVLELQDIADIATKLESALNAYR